MSGYPYGNPQYPAPQNQIYPQIYNPANGPPPNNPTAMSYSAPPGQNTQYPGQNPQYPGQNPQYIGQPQAYLYQSGFAYAYPGQPGQLGHPGQAGQAGQPGQPIQVSSYPGVAAAPTAPPSYGFGYPQVTPQCGPQGAMLEWQPTTPKAAQALADRAVVAGFEGYDNSPLWVIRARHQGDLIPGKLALKHQAAYVPWGGKENSVTNIEVLCARPECVRWVESRGGTAVPPNAIPGGNTASGETLYIGRAKEQGSLTPGKVHQSHKVIYISFGGLEIAHKTYEVLCTV